MDDRRAGTTSCECELDDVDLVRRARAGEPEAVAELIERLAFLRVLLARRNARLGTPIDASEVEDVLQEVFLSIWTRLERFRYGRLEAWVLRFTSLAYLARLRRARRRPASLEEIGIRAALSMSDPGADLHLLEQGRAYVALQELGPPEAAIIRLKLLEDLSFTQVAAQLGAPVNTVKARYYRGLRRLRDRTALQA